MTNKHSHLIFTFTKLSWKNVSAVQQCRLLNGPWRNICSTTCTFIQQYKNPERISLVQTQLKMSYKTATNLNSIFSLSSNAAKRDENNYRSRIVSKRVNRLSSSRRIFIRLISVSFRKVLRSIANIELNNFSLFDKLNEYVTLLLDDVKSQNHRIY